jgi:hypothetical protein
VRLQSHCTGIVWAASLGQDCHYLALIADTAPNLRVGVPIAKVSPGFLFSVDRDPQVRSKMLHIVSNTSLHRGEHDLLE